MVRVSSTMTPNTHLGHVCGKIDSWVYWVLLLPQGERANS